MQVAGETLLLVLAQGPRLMEVSPQQVLPPKPLQWEGKRVSHTMALTLVCVSHMATSNLKKTEKHNSTVCYGRDGGWAGRGGLDDQH